MKNVAALHGFLQCFIMALLFPCELYPNRHPCRPVCEKSSYCPPYYFLYRKTPSWFCVAEVPPVLTLLQRNAGSQGGGKRFRQCSIKHRLSGSSPRAAVIPLVPGGVVLTPCITTARRYFTARILHCTTVLLVMEI